MAISLVYPVLIEWTKIYYSILTSISLFIRRVYISYIYLLNILSLKETSILFAYRVYKIISHWYKKDNSNLQICNKIFLPNYQNYFHFIALFHIEVYIFIHSNLTLYSVIYFYLTDSIVWEIICSLEIE